MIRISGLLARTTFGIDEIVELPIVAIICAMAINGFGGFVAFDIDDLVERS